MDKPNYYAIIPAEVRYSAIKPSAKLLYGEITCLSNLKGYCYATNNYFSKLYGVSKNTISLWIKDLNVAGFISVEMIYKNKQIIERRMTIINFKKGGIKNDEGGGLKNSEVNSTSINTTSNISIRELKFINTVSLLDYDSLVKKEFCEYWTEQNQSKTKMKFEMEKTWSLKKRIERWINNSKKWNHNKTSKLESTISAHQESKAMLEKLKQ